MARTHITMMQQSKFFRDKSLPINLRAKRFGVKGSIIKYVSITRGNSYRSLPVRGRRSRRYHMLVSRSQSGKLIAVRRLARKHPNLRPIFVRELDGGKRKTFQCLMKVGSNKLLRSKRP